MEPKSGRFSGYSASSSSSSTVWGIGFRFWVNSILAEMRRKSPVQQWVDSIPKAEPSSEASDANERNGNSLKPSRPPPPPSKPTSLFAGGNEDPDEGEDPAFQIECVESNDNVASRLDLSAVADSAVRRRLANRSSSSRGAMLVRERSTNSEGNSPKHRHPFFRDSSFQSEGAASRCSSVESLLESRRVDAEAVLRGVGFGPSPARQQLARIPDRFLKPSKVQGINTEQFIKEEQKSMKMHECGVFGYRGLTGNPHVPPSTIVAKIIERISSRDELPESNYYLQITQADIDTC